MEHQPHTRLPYSRALTLVIHPQPIDKPQRNLSILEDYPRCWQIGGQEVTPNERMGEENIKSKNAQAFIPFMLHYVGKQVLSKMSILRNSCRVSSIKAIREGTFMDAKIDNL